MKTVFRIVIALGAVTAVAEAQRETLLKQSSVVFVGRVVQVQAASFAGVPVSPRTLVAEVEEVVEKPAAVSLAPGDQVTVEAKDPSLLTVGTRVTFYADGWILGKGVALREVGHEVVAPSGEGAAGGETGRQITAARQVLNDQALRARLDAAAMVCVGTVESVRAATLAPAGSGTRVTEHDPQWQEAIIRVESPIKGAQANQQIVVRFPGSEDVAWYQVPKFTAGQQGTFILSRDQVSGAPQALLGGQTVDAYTAMTAGDVLPRGDADRIRALLGQ
jgi:plastocyanin